MIKANNGPNEILEKCLLKPIVVTSFILLKGNIRAFFTFYLDFSTVPLQIPLFICLSHAFGGQQLHPEAWLVNSEISSCGQLLE